METDKSKKNNCLIGFFIVILIVGGYFYFFKNQGSKTGGGQVTVASFQDTGKKLSDDIINCEFDVISDFIYENAEEPTSKENRKVYYNTFDSKTPSLITFAGLSTKEPKIKGNQGEAPLIMLKNDAESIVLVEQNTFGDMFLYTIFKRDKVAVWYKAYRLLTSPYAMLSMGYCY